ncbi:MAG: hypothetical protein ACFFCI_03535 [Promethearchaeota archaeon]
MSKTFVNLRHLEIKSISERFKNENCEILSLNCYEMQESPHFKTYYETIGKQKYWNQTKEYYLIMERNMKGFKFKP